MAEAAHRIKNTLAVVQAIVSQTIRTAKDLEEGGLSIERRVAALAAAQDILTGAEGAAADIMSVVMGALAPHDAGNGRLIFDGPSHPLEAPQALGLSLALHELATNAAKYGALSNESGVVSIKWSVENGGKFEMEWLERGGPIVETPSKTGFGSKLIQRMVGPYFKGTTSLDFTSEGVRFHLKGALAEKPQP